MPPARRLAPVHLGHHLRKMVTAHAAVQAGIATHAQEETEKRHLAQARMETGAVLPAPVKPHGA